MSDNIDDTRELALKVSERTMSFLNALQEKSDAFASKVRERKTGYGGRTKTTGDMQTELETMLKRTLDTPEVAHEIAESGGPNAVFTRIVSGLVELWEEQPRKVDELSFHYLFGNWVKEAFGPERLFKGQIPARPLFDFLRHNAEWLFTEEALRFMDAQYKGSGQAQQQPLSEETFTDIEIASFEETSVEGGEPKKQRPVSEIEITVPGIVAKVRKVKVVPVHFPPPAKEELPDSVDIPLPKPEKSVEVYRSSIIGFEDLQGSQRAKVGALLFNLKHLHSIDAASLDDVLEGVLTGPGKKARLYLYSKVAYARDGGVEQRTRCEAEEITGVMWQSPVIPYLDAGVEDEGRTGQFVIEAVWRGPFLPYMTGNESSEELIRFRDAFAAMRAKLIEFGFDEFRKKGGASELYTRMTQVIKKPGQRCRIAVYDLADPEVGGDYRLRIEPESFQTELQDIRQTVRAVATRLGEFGFPEFHGETAMQNLYQRLRHILRRVGQRCRVVVYDKGNEEAGKKLTYHVELEQVF